MADMIWRVDKQCYCVAQARSKAHTERINCGPT